MEHLLPWQWPCERIPFSLEDLAVITCCSGCVRAQRKVRDRVLAGASGLQQHLSCSGLTLSAGRSLNRPLSSPPGQRKGRFFKTCEFAAHICQNQRHRSATLPSSYFTLGNRRHTTTRRAAETANNSRPHSVLLSLRPKRSSRTPPTCFSELLYSLFYPLLSL